METGWHKEWHLGVRSETNNQLVGFISAVPCAIRIFEKQVSVAKVSFLCVDKMLRSKRLTPMLVREIYRRMKQKNVYVAVFSAVAVIPKPITVCRF